MSLEDVKKYYLMFRGRPEWMFREWVARARHYLGVFGIEVPDEDTG